MTGYFSNSAGPGEGQNTEFIKQTSNCRHFKELHLLATWLLYEFTDIQTSRYSLTYSGNKKKGVSHFSVCERHKNTLGSTAKSHSVTPRLDGPNSAASERNTNEKQQFCASDYLRLFLSYSTRIFPATFCFFSDIIMTLAPPPPLPPPRPFLCRGKVSGAGRFVIICRKLRSGKMSEFKSTSNTHAFHSCQVSKT